MYYGFADQNDVRDQFEISTEDLNGVNILLATYERDGFEGFAFILFEAGGALYEVNGSHCSCYGFGGRWKPEPVEWEDLRHRLNESKYFLRYVPGARAYLQELVDHNTH